MKLSRNQWIVVIVVALALLGKCGGKQTATKQTVVHNVTEVATKTVVFTPTIEETKDVPTNTVVLSPTITQAAASIPTPQATKVAATAVVDAGMNAASSPCKIGQIKGSQKGIYHLPGGRDYKRTKKNVTCFDTIDAAKAAGFVPSANP